MKRRWPARLVCAILLSILTLGYANDPAAPVGLPHDEWPSLRPEYIQVLDDYGMATLTSVYGPVPDTQGMLHAVGLDYARHTLVHLTNNPVKRTLTGWSIEEVVAPLPDSVFDGSAALGYVLMSLAIGPDDTLHATWLHREEDAEDQVDPEFFERNALYYAARPPNGGWSGRLRLDEQQAHQLTTGMLPTGARCPRLSIDAAGNACVAWAQYKHHLSIVALPWDEVFDPTENRPPEHPLFITHSVLDGETRRYEVDDPKDAVHYWSSASGRTELSPADPDYNDHEVFHVALTGTPVARVTWAYREYSHLTHMRFGPMRVVQGGPGRGAQVFLNPGGLLRPGTLCADPQGVVHLAGVSVADGALRLYPLDGGASVPLAGVPPGFSEDEGGMAWQPIAATVNGDFHVLCCGYWDSGMEFRLSHQARIGAQWKPVAYHRRGAPSLAFASDGYSFVQGDRDGRLVIGGDSFGHAVEVERDLGAYEQAQVHEAGPYATANPTNGNLIVQIPVFHAESAGLDLDQSLAYNSLDFTPGPLGPGWTHSFDVYATWTPTGPVIHWGDGNVSDPANRRASTREGRFSARFVDELSLGPLYFVTLDGTKYEFRKDGRLEKIQDPNGNSLTLSYEDNPKTPAQVETLLATVTDQRRRVVRYAYDGQNRIEKITDPALQTYSFTYDPASARLASVKFNQAHDEFGFAYYPADGPFTADGGPRRNALRSLTTPGGIVTTYLYHGDRRIAQAEDALHHKIRWHYTNPDTTTNVIATVKLLDRRDQEVTLECDLRGGVVRNATDPLGGRVSRTFDSFGNVKTEVDERGGTTSFLYAYEDRATAGGSDWERSLIAQATRPGPATRAFTYYSGEPEVNAQANRLKTAAEPVTVDGVIPQSEFEYDRSGNLKTWYPPGTGRDVSKARRFDYEPGTGRLTAAYDAKGVTHYRYDEAELDPELKTGLPVRIQRGQHPEEIRAYDLMGRMVVRTAPSGARTVLVRNARGQVEKQTSPGGTAGTDRVRKWDYDGDGRLLTSTNLRGRITGYRHNAAGQATTIHYANGLWEGADESGGSGLDPNGNLLRYRDVRGNVTSRTYDELGRVQTEERPEGLSVVYEYHPTGELHRELVTGRLGKGPGRTTLTTIYDVDGRGNLTLVTLPSAGPDAITGATDTLSFKFTWREDDTLQDRVLQKNGAFHEGERQEYSARGWVRKVSPLTAEDTTAAWGTTYDYDGNGNRTYEEDAGGLIRRTEYNDLNLPKVVQDPRVGDIQYAWDDEGRPTQADAPSPSGKGRVVLSSAGYDLAGNVTRNEEHQDIAHDIEGHPTWLKDQAGKVTQQDFDPETGVLTETRRLNVRRWVGDAGVTLTTKYAPNSFGDVEQVTNPLLRTWAYHFDPLGRVDRITAPAVPGQPALIRTFEFNDFGDVVEERDEAGKLRQTEYDALNRPWQEKRWFGGGSLDETLTWSYDPAGRVKVARAVKHFTTGTSTSQEDRGYDFVGRLKTVHLSVPAAAAPHGPVLWRTLSYNYDNAGRPTGLTVPQEGVAIVYGYSPSKALETITRNGSLVARYEPRPGGAPGTIIHGNGVKAAYDYQDNGRVRGLATADANGKTLAAYLYEYQTADRLSHIHEVRQRTWQTLEHNEVGWLLEEKAESWTEAPIASATTGQPPGNWSGHREIAARTGDLVQVRENYDTLFKYDEAGNRTWMNTGALLTRDYRYHPDNRLDFIDVQEEGRAYRQNYGTDPTGNVTTIEQVEGGAAQTTVLNYDAADRLEYYEYAGGEAGGYRYGPGGERLFQYTASTGQFEWHLHDGANLLGTYGEPAGGGEPSAFVLKEAYTNGLGLDQLLQVTTPEGQANPGSRTLIRDGVGTATHVTRPDGTVEQTLAPSDAFGMLVRTAGGNPLTQTRFSFAGREQDRELVYHRARHYDPKAGRFLQPDPVLGNRPHEGYTYARNNPSSYVDADGHVAILAALPILGKAVALGLAAAGAYWTGQAVGGLAREVYDESYYPLSDQHALKAAWNDPGRRGRMIGTLGAGLAREATYMAAGYAALRGSVAAGRGAWRWWRASSTGIGGRMLAGSGSARFAPCNRVSGEIYPNEGIKALSRYLDVRGVKLDHAGDKILPANKAAAFVVEQSGNARMILRSNPRMSEVWHELSHYRDWKRLGTKEYLAISDAQAEANAFHLLSHSPIYERLSITEVTEAIDSFQVYGLGLPMRPIELNLP